MRRTIFSGGFLALAAGAAWISVAGAASARDDAWSFAKLQIRAESESSNVPRLFAWPNMKEVYPCPVDANGMVSHFAGLPETRILTFGAALDRGFGIQAADDLVNGVAPDKPDFGESFHYNPIAAARLCGAVETTPDPSLSPPMFRGLTAWRNAHRLPSKISPFVDGSIFAVTLWQAVRYTVDAAMGDKVQLVYRDPDGVLAVRKVRITTSGGTASGVDPRQWPSECPDPDFKGTGPDPNSVSDSPLRNFYWMRLGRNETYSSAKCGDFAVLVGFHLLHKVGDKWLWSTFWWDDQAPAKFSGAPADFLGAGSTPDAWRNYAMDATYDSSGEIFNPWKANEMGKNCAACHLTSSVVDDGGSSQSISFDSIVTAMTHFKMLDH